MVPSRPSRRARLRRARAVPVPRRPWPRRRRTAEQLAIGLRRPGLDQGHRRRRGPRPVVPAPVRRPAAGLQLAQPGRRGPLRVDPALLVRPRHRRLPHRRGARPGQAPRTAGRRPAAGAGPLTHVEPPGRARRVPPVAADRRLLRGPRPHPGRRDLGPRRRGPRAVPASRRAAPGLLLRPADPALAGTRAAGSRRERAAAHRRGRGSGDLDPVEPRRPPAGHPIRPGPVGRGRLQPGPRCRHPGPRPGRPGAGAPVRPVGDPHAARAARVGVPLSGRGTGPARGDGPPTHRPPGPDRRPKRRQGLGPRRLPGPDPLGARRAILRLLADRPAGAAVAAPTGLVRRLRRGRGADRPGVVPEPVPAGAPAAS